LLALLIAACAVLGLVIGSFLNVVVYRVPRRESVVAPRSRCPACGMAIIARDNIPVLSWLLLKGRCRYCHSKISIRYPIVEIACAVLFGGLAGRLGLDWDLPAMLALFAGLLAVSITDVEHMVVPRAIVYPTTALVASLFLFDAGVTGQWHRLLIAGLCAVGWFLTFLAINLLNSRYLGFGDVRLSFLLGLGLGWFGVRFVILGFFASSFLGAVIGLVLIASKKVGRQQPIPFGVFLAMGTAFAVFAGPELLAPLHRFL
jgi:leader peptidase (prepilin peptidase)/N-methyltransferase